MKKSKQKQQLEDFNSALSSLAAKVKVLEETRLTIKNDDPVYGVDKTSIKIPKQKLEVGKWHISEFNANYIVYVNSLNKDCVDVYGFDVNNKWFEDEIELKLFWNKERPLLEAPKEEVERALINEAKRRGFKEGVKFKSVATGSEFKLKGNIDFYKEYNLLMPYNGCIFENGKWAEIVEETKEIDWSVPGQLVESEYMIVLVSKSTYVDCFSGTVVSFKEKNLSRHILGECYDLFRKSKFTLYKGSITLSNEPI